ncbi:PAS domain S-box protein [Halobellus captivus]|uniref:PAS domain S-box protein n=1 Tax=Halobellus captivus TaxID=2592614 RepID=UPI0011A6EBA0|nr:PAS domain S-box protein [Halobellus captivus]
MTSEQSPAPGTSVLVLVSNPGNRRVLVDWVRSTEGYEFADPTADGTASDGSLPEFDVCLADRSELRKFADEIRETRSRPHTFLPCLLIDERGADFESVSPSIRGLVDDVMTAPIDPAHLRFRVDTLARRRRISLELWETEERYRRLFELAPNAKFLLDDTEIRATNRAAERFLGRDSDSLEGTELETFVVDRDRSTLAELLAAAPSEVDPAGPTFQTLTFEFDDRTAICEVATVRTGEGSELLVLVQDITERIEREHQLELYRRAMDEATIGITITDPTLPDNPMIYVNDQFVETTGYNREEALGRNCRFLQGDGTDRQAAARVRRAIERQQPVSEILVNYRKNGEPFYNALDVMPVRDESGTVTNFLGFQRDVTEWVRNRRRLSVLDRVLRHNVRNRMNVVTGYAEQLLDHDDPDVRAAAERIEAAGDDLLRQSETARHFRDVVNNESTAVGTRDLVADVTAAIEEISAGYPDAEIATSLPPEACIRGDDGVSLAVVELIENAAEHGAPPIIVSVESDPDETVLSVSDGGEGIPRVERAVFDDLDERPTRHAGGVGLWLVRWTVERIGGRIEYPDPDSSTVELYFATADGDRDRTDGPDGYIGRGRGLDRSGFGI